jgi:hypothetical protein
MHWPPVPTLIYDGAGRMGLCAMPYFSESGRTEGIIDGIHVAANSVHTMAAEVYKEDILEAMKILGIRSSEVDTGVMLVEGEAQAIPGLSHIGKTTKPIFQPKSRDHLSTGLDLPYKENWKMSVISRNSQTVLDASEGFFEHNIGIHREIMNTPTSLDLDAKYESLSVEAAIFGQPDIPGFSPKKGAGPFLTGNNETRETVVDFENKKIRPDFYRRIMTYLLMWASCIVTPHAVSAIFKDEVVKATKKKGRMFFVCDFALNVALKTIWAPIVVRTICKMKTGPHIGFNPLGMAGRMLYSELTSKSQRVDAADASFWDQTFYIHFVDYLILDISTKTQINQVQLNTLKYSLLSALHPWIIIGEDVYTSVGMMPSGCWLTTFLNSLYNDWRLRVCWNMWLVQNPCFPSVPYETVNSSVTTGDDSLRSYLDTYKGYLVTFDPEFVAKYSRILFDLRITAADKSDNIRLVPILEAEFLKRKFKFCRGQIFMALDPRVIYRMVLYVSSGLPFNEAFSTNYSTALREAWFHGEEFYETFRSQVNCSLEESGRAELKSFIPFNKYDFFLQGEEGTEWNVKFDL